MDHSLRGSSSGGDAQLDTPPPSRPPNNAAQAALHQRTYQACIPCRKRKVRCDLGSVDNPSDPPCVRCRRESKECYFSATRRKKKTGTDDAYSDTDETVFKVENGRKRVRQSEGYEPEKSVELEEAPRTPGGSIGQAQPLRRPAGPKPVQYNEEDQKASEQTVSLLQATEIHGGHDALKLLAEAARKGSRESGPRPGITGLSPSSLPSATSPMMERPGSMTNGPMAVLQNDPIWKTPINPTSHASDPVDTAAYNSALKAWERFRFVRAGWFRAKEAIDYIDYFYRHHAPLTPVALLDFRSYAKHEELLTNEPMLTITMLLIASRHMQLEGPGSVSRPYSIHQKLWTYLSGMINRILWGQEQFGGGFCGAGGEPGCDVNPLTRKGLRTLGTIESLVLLTEWHPRAMHFPPDEADEELMVPEDPSHLFDPSESGPENKGIGGQRMDAWLEPCWRSDRMCWMLLGLSMSLAFEIGVFDSGEWQRHARSSDGQPLSAEQLQSYDRRRRNVRNLLLVYVTQTSGRLGLTSLLPNGYSKPEDSDLFRQTLNQHSSIHETDLHFWLRMAHLMREGNHKIYANKSFTRDLIKNGDYKAVLQAFQVPLRQWRLDFDQCAIIPRYMRYILEIEYEYCRVYINALALQAVAERCANAQPFQNSTDAPDHAARAGSVPNGVRPEAGAIPPQMLAKLLGGDRHYMLQVGDAARNLLKVVVYGLYPGEYLKHAPVRTYFRIISASIVLLKSFSLGATESDVSDSLQLMDKTVDALRNCIVDDVHVACRFADLLDTLTQNLKPRLVRIAADGRSKSRRASIFPGAEAAAGLDQQQAAAAQTTASFNDANKKLQAHQRSNNTSAPHQQNPSHPHQWPYTNNGIPLANTPSDPLYGISSDIYDLTDSANQHFSIMPPPSFAWSSPTNSQTLGLSATSPGGTNMYSFGTGGPGGGVAEDWFALDLNPIINSDAGGQGGQNVDVSSTMYGPQIGDTDMLELLLGGGGAVGQNF